MQTEGPWWRRAASWLLGLLLLSTLLGVVLQFAEIGNFMRLLRGAEPVWLLLALLAQLSTYVCAAGVWYLALRVNGHPKSLRSLVPMGLAKLFTDQAFPSGGLSGTALVLHSLHRRHVPAHATMSALMIGLVSFNTAYLAAVLAAAALLGWHGHLTLPLIGAVSLFSIVAVVIPTAVLWLHHVDLRRRFPWLKGIPGLHYLLDAVADAPTAPLRNPGLLLATSLLQGAIFLLDASTLWFAFRAVGMTAPAWAVFASFIMASVAATIGPVPLGLGTFEAACVGMLSLLDQPLEASLTATLLLRGFTFWLPMLPGMLLVRRELRPRRPASGTGHSPI